MASGLWKAMIDAILGQSNNAGGQAITELTAPLAADETSEADVLSTIRFGLDTDNSPFGGNARFLINGEIITSTQRPFSHDAFLNLTRGVDSTIVKLHPAGSIVYDLSRNRSGLDLVRRGVLVRTARLEDLDILGRNLGLHRCPGLDEETWRALIEVMAYLPNQPIAAFKAVLDVFPGVGNYTIFEDLIEDPMQVFVEVSIPTVNDLHGKFFLNGGEERVANGAGTQVTTVYNINQVLGVFDDTDDTRAGNRDGHTNYFTAGSFLGNVITLGTPTAPNAPVIVDYGAFTAHYLAPDETARFPGDGEFFPYLSDPSAIVQCLLDQVRAAGVKVTVTATLI